MAVGAAAGGPPRRRRPVLSPAPSFHERIRGLERGEGVAFPQRGRVSVKSVPFPPDVIWGSGSDRSAIPWVLGCSGWTPAVRTPSTGRQRPKHEAPSHRFPGGRRARRGAAPGSVPGQALPALVLRREGKQTLPLGEGQAPGQAPGRRKGPAGPPAPPCPQPAGGLCSSQTPRGSAGGGNPAAQVVKSEPGDPAGPGGGATAGLELVSSLSPEVVNQGHKPNKAPRPSGMSVSSRISATITVSESNP